MRRHHRGGNALAHSKALYMRGGTITVDAVRAQLAKLGRHDVSDARIEEFLRQRPTRRDAGVIDGVGDGDDDDDDDDDDDEGSVVKATTATSHGDSDEYNMGRITDSIKKKDARAPWNGDAFELLSLREQTAQTRVYPRRKAYVGDEIGKIDVVQLGAEYREAWSRSPLLSDTARPKVGYAEKFAALHEAERLKMLNRRAATRTKRSVQ